MGFWDSPLPAGRALVSFALGLAALMWGASSLRRPGWPRIAGGVTLALAAVWYAAVGALVVRRGIIWSALWSRPSSETGRHNRFADFTAAATWFSVSASLLAARLRKEHRPGPQAGRS